MEINLINEKIKKNIIDDELMNCLKTLREKEYTLKFDFDKNLKNNQEKLKLIMKEFDNLEKSKI